MQSSTTWWAVLGLVLVGLAGCGSDSDDGGGAAPPNTTLATTINAAAAVPANDTSTNPTAPFTVLQGASVPAVTVASPPKVNFTVFSDGAVKTGLTLADMSFAIAKLVPGTNGNPDEWQNYVSRQATATAAGSPGAAMSPPATAMQATTDPERTPDELAAAGLGPQLAYHDEGYYTYTFSTDITNPAWSATINNAAYSTNGVVFDPNATHRVAIQLSYTNAAGEVIRVNPRFDFRYVQNSSGGYDSVLLTDPATQSYVIDDRRVVLQHLPREAGLARRRARRHAVLRDVPQPGHHRSRQRQRADDVDDDPQDPRRARAGRQPGRRALHHLGLQQRQVRFLRDWLPAGAAELRQVPHGAEPEHAAGRQLEEHAFRKRPA